VVDACRLEKQRGKAAGGKSRSKNGGKSRKKNRNKEKVIHERKKRGEW